MTSTAQHYLSFRVGTQWYGIAVHAVVEVHHMMLLTALPRPRPNVLGMMTLRDTVFPVLDLRLYFGIPNPRYQLDTPIIALKTSSGILGLVADDTDNIETISEQQIVSPEGDSLPYVVGVTRLRDRLLLLLDTTLFSTEIQILPERRS